MHRLLVHLLFLLRLIVYFVYYFIVMLLVLAICKANLIEPTEIMLINKLKNTPNIEYFVSPPFRILPHQKSNFLKIIACGGGGGGGSPGNSGRL